MKKAVLLLSTFAVLGLGSALAAAPEDNLAGTELCIDNNSFTAQVGSLGTTSQKVAQGLYDYFVATATASKIPFKEMGDQSCVNWAVNFAVEATNGNPRAWVTTLTVSDDGAYASLNKDDLYTYPVVIWWDYYFGYSASNDGLGQYLIDGGKELIDELLEAYIKVN
ncbi:hypothetical protein [Deinococcus roseus]|uniref:Uncharacterized protein n=1 Tax=Deinococcus roseus TaxID=392414 RepID=A0ABQ2CYP6_9DEIO|nr:hypothetical protein [Deinococcus roseus]GGJ34042.1 hypothetical protein GCM10008938_20320 [Deinococcus roseus]